MALGTAVSSFVCRAEGKGNGCAAALLLKALLKGLGEDGGSPSRCLLASTECRLARTGCRLALTPCFLSWWDAEDPRLGKLRAQELLGWQTAPGKLLTALQARAATVQGCPPGPAGHSAKAKFTPFFYKSGR